MLNLWILVPQHYWNTHLMTQLKFTSKLIWSITVVHLSLDILDSNLICFFRKASELFYLRRSFNKGPLHSVCSILKQFLLERALKEITNIPTGDTNSHMGYIMVTNRTRMVATNVSERYLCFIQYWSLDLCLFSEIMTLKYPFSAIICNCGKVICHKHGKCQHSMVISLGKYFTNSMEQTFPEKLTAVTIQTNECTQFY